MAKTYSSMTVAQLKAKLEENNLETLGNKSDLVKRLEEHTALLEESGDTEMVEEESLTEPTEENQDLQMDSEAGNLANGGDTVDPEADPLVNLANLSVEDLQAELIKRNIKTESVQSEPKKPSQWVRFIDQEPDKKIFSRLQKMEKMTSFIRRTKEMNNVLQALTVHIYPVPTDILSYPGIQDILRICSTTHLRFTNHHDDNAPVGLLDLVFRKKSHLTESLATLTDLDPDFTIIHSPSDDTWIDDAKIQAPRFAPAHDGNLVFASSLPLTLTTDDMWDLFPEAKTIFLIDSTPRKHAYIVFPSADVITEAVDRLNSEGPTKDGFQFCSLVRSGRMQDLMKQNLPLNPRTAGKNKGKQVAKNKQEPTQTASGTKRPFSPGGGADGGKNKKSKFEPQGNKPNAPGVGGATPTGQKKMKKMNSQTQQGNSATQGVARGGGGGGRGAKKRPNNQQQQSNPNTQGAGQGANRGRGAGGRGANKGRGAGGRGANKGRGAGGLGAARGAGRGSVGNYGAARGFGGNRGAARGLVRNMGGGHVASGGPNAWDFMPPKNYSPGYGNNTRSYPDQIDDRVQYREPAPYEQSARFDEQSARQSARFDEQSARQSARFDGQSARFDEQSARYDERPRYNEQSYQYSSQEPDVKLNSAMETLSKLSRLRNVPMSAGNMPMSGGNFGGSTVPRNLQQTYGRNDYANFN